MKKLYQLNKWLVIATLILYLTVILGMAFQIILGCIQVLMSLYILTHFKSLDRKLKPLFIFYISITTVILILIVTNNYNNWYSTNGTLLWIILPMTLAFLHLFITYKIYKS